MEVKVEEIVNNIVKVPEIPEKIEETIDITPLFEKWVTSGKVGGLNVSAYLLDADKHFTDIKPQIVSIDNELYLSLSPYMKFTYSTC